TALRFSHTATLLSSGDVLVTGPTATAEIYSTLGEACGAMASCPAGRYCIAGVCCDSPCLDTCYTCASPSAPGHCVPEPVGARHACGGLGCNGACDGHGKCVGIDV